MRHPKKSDNRPARARLAAPLRRAPPAEDQFRGARLRGLVERAAIAGFGPRLSPPIGTGAATLPDTRSSRGVAAEVLARQVAMYLGHVACGLSYGAAGHLYARDRTTAAHACGIIEARRDDATFDRIIDLLERAVQLGLRQVEPAAPAAAAEAAFAAR